MKSQKRILSVCAAALLLTGAGSTGAFAIDVSVTNKTAETVNIMLYTRSDYSWDKFSTAFSNPQPIKPAGTYTFSVPVDSRHMCPSYLAGYNSNYSKSIVMIGCDGIEVDNSKARCCFNASFEVYKKSDGSLHFRIK